jgi:hypothetical protein
MGLFSKTYAELSNEAIEILNQVKAKITDNSDFAWVPYNSAEELRNEIEECIDQLRMENKSSLDNTYSHFLPTATFQEHSMSNGWSAEYRELANKFDKVYKQMKSYG